MSKQANQKYRKEMEFNHKERAKDSNPASDCTSNTVKDMPAGKVTAMAIRTVPIAPIQRKDSKQIRLS